MTIYEYDRGALPPVAPKNLVLCLDGTNDQIGVSEPSNVAKVFCVLGLLDPHRQVAYYDPGIGTLPAPHARGAIERHLSVGEELAFGIGLRHKLTEAYTWLMRNYRFGDRIYVFGFSRGAYTARALVGMLHCPGLLRPGSDNLIDYAVERYATNDWPETEDDCNGIQEFSDAFCWGTHSSPVSSAGRPRGDDTSTGPHEDTELPPVGPGFFVPKHSVPVSFLGVWDTVEASGAAGIGEHHWRFADTVPNAARVRHAVSIHEWRPAFRPLLLADRPETEGPEEVWFAGVHSDVGGTYEDDDRLAVIALKWVFDGAARDLILREPDSYESLFTGLYDPGPYTTPAYAARVHPLSDTWKILGRARRQIPRNAWIHDSAVRRCDDPDAGPPIQLPRGYEVADADWLRPIAAGELPSEPAGPAQ